MVVKLEGTLTIPGLCTSVESRPSTGYQFARNSQLGPSRLLFSSTDPKTKGRPYRVTFFQSAVLDFKDIVYIADVPVFPPHAMLLQEINHRARSPYSKWKGSLPSEEVARFLLDCLLACAATPLTRFSDLWKSPEILAEVERHIQALPNARKHWLSRGIDPSNPNGARATTPSPPQSTVDETEENEDEDEDDDDDEEEEEGEEEEEEEEEDAGPQPDPEPPEPERPSALRSDGRSPVTDIVAVQVVDVLKRLGYQCAILDSAACYLYSEGQSRGPEVRPFGVSFSERY